MNDQIILRVTISKGLKVLINILIGIIAIIFLFQMAMGDFNFFDNWYFFVIGIPTLLSLRSQIITFNNEGVRMPKIGLILMNEIENVNFSEDGTTVQISFKKSNISNTKTFHIHKSVSKIDLDNLKNYISLKMVKKNEQNI